MNYGCGVTAFDERDAFRILADKGILREQLRIEKILVDFDVSILDEKHVMTNMGVIAVRGIWYPLGYQF